MKEGGDGLMVCPDGHGSGYCGNSLSIVWEA